MPEFESPAKECCTWPAFLVGSYRSGSTLLRHILDAHPDLACPPETKLVAPLISLLGYPEVLRGLQGLGLTQSQSLHKLGLFLDSLLTEYANRRGKRRWIEKTPSHYKHIAAIDEMFGKNVLYVGLVRHPLDCVASLDEFMSPLYHEDPVIASHVRAHGRDRSSWARFWLSVYETVAAAAAARPSRFIIVRYEDLAADPESVIKRILEFLGERYQTGLADRAFRLRHGSGLGDPKFLLTSSIHSRSVGRWRAWPEAEVQILWSLVEHIAVHFGYNISGD